MSLAGVQLEIGSVATSFAYEDVETTLQKCYRYLYRLQANNASGQGYMGLGYAVDTNSIRVRVPMRTEMRAIPTLTSSSVSTSDLSDGATQTATSAIAFQAGTPGGCQIQLTADNQVVGHACGWYADSGETFDFSAEL